MVAVVPPRIYLWSLSVIGIFIVITITCSEASSMVNSLDKVKVVINGSSNVLSSSTKHNKHEINADNIDGNTTTPALLARPKKTSFKCKGKPPRLCERGKLKASGSNRSKPDDKGAFQSRQLPVDGHGMMMRHYNKDKESTNNKRSYKSVNISNSDYLPVKYGTYGYNDDVSEGRGWITVPLFIIFSIIQFKLVAAIFLAFFGPMILFLLIVQGFLFKATLVMLGLMMS